MPGDGEREGQNAYPIDFTIGQANACRDSQPDSDVTAHTAYGPIVTLFETMHPGIRHVH